MQIQAPVLTADALVHGQTAVRLDNDALILCVSGIPNVPAGQVGCIELASGNVVYLNTNSQVIAVNYKAVPEV